MYRSLTISYARDLSVLDFLSRSQNISEQSNVSVYIAKTSKILAVLNICSIVLRTTPSAAVIKQRQPE